MFQRALSYTRQYRHSGALYVNRAVGGLTLMLMHEIDALTGHVAEVRERLAVARQSQGLGELLRKQVDLLPETRARLVLDQRERSALLHSWVADLRAGALSSG